MAKPGDSKPNPSLNAPAKRPIAVMRPKASPDDLARMEEEIRRRAYQLYEERGGQHGFDQDDWLRAEAEVRTRSGVRSAS
ncbi:MAG TPA: DUF2934 domain-containing protein [Terriglobales bacterium]|jgi:hypothetical protein|nr:DUF2934 domain-containing protein [Terriglobales bacterium]